MRALSAALVLLVACGGGDDGGDDAPKDDIAPAVSASVPPNGATGVWLYDPIKVTFSEEIEYASSAITLRAGDTPIDFDARFGNDRRSIELTIKDVAAVGDVTLSLSNLITDLAGNKLAPATITWNVPPWQRPEGFAGAAPAMVQNHQGGLFVAAQTGAAGARRITVRLLEAGTWIDLGELGSGDAVAPSMARDSDGAPVVAWIENPGGAATIEAARWSSGAWQPLPSPGAVEIRPAVGAGQEPVVLAPAMTETMNGAAIAWASGTSTYAIQVRRLENSTWTAVGDPLPGGAVIAPPAIVLMGPRGLAVAVLAAQFESPGRFPSQRIAVHTWDGAAWTETTPLGAGLAAGDLDGITEVGEAAPRVSMSTSDNRLVLAWDERELSNANVFVAMSDGAGWKRLGGALTIDPGSEATSPVLAQGASQPMVAWRERGDGRERGVLATWTDPTWTVVGEPWNADAQRPVAPALLPWPTGGVIVAWQRDTDIAIARFSGPATPGPGLAERSSARGCALGASPPAELADTGCFDIDGGRTTPNVGLIPYDVIVEGWTDGSQARRWLALPDGAALTATAGAWTAPVGTLAIQELGIEATPGDGASRRAVETRFLERAADGWRAVSYRWRADGSGAELLAGDAATTQVFPRGSGTYTHLYPSRAECRLCHTDATGPLLGVRSEQLARHVAYGRLIADQRATLAHIGAVSGDTAASPLVSPLDPSQSFELRMRGYLAANCADCHAPGGGAPGDYRFATAFAATGLCDVMSPGDSSSDILARVRSRSATPPRGMPTVGTRIFDALGVHVVGKWIADAPATLCP